MTDSLRLMTATISFLDPQLVLVHIPLKYYSFFVQPLLRLLFGEDHDEDAANVSWTNRHDFLNICINPIECSIICTRYLVDKYIVPIDRILSDLLQNEHTGGTGVKISRDNYIAIQVDGEGLDAGLRVLELTGPLAMAGISIFFITTYFSDYILVPSRDRHTVTSALQQRGFVFSEAEDAFVSQLSPSLHFNHGGHESTSYMTANPWSLGDSHMSWSAAPPTPPAQDIDELQSRTFKKLKRYDIQPQVDKSLRLVSCAGSREPSPKKEAKLKNDLLQVLLATCPKPLKKGELLVDQHISGAPPVGSLVDESMDWSAKFLSITITSSEPISILLEERLLPRLGNSLYGAKSEDDVMVPIILDLRTLGLETTGIIGGVAGCLAQRAADLYHHREKEQSYHSEGTSPRTAEHLDAEDVDVPLEISFLSTARAGTVTVRASHVQYAFETLQLAMRDG